MSISVDWSDLPPELLETIAKKLKIHKDYVRFRAVCLAWRDATPRIPKHLPCQLPWLMLPRRTNQDPQSNVRSFLNVSDEKIHQINLPEDSDSHRRCGSSFGWLVILEETPTISIVNPLTQAKHHLPPLSSFPNVTSFEPCEIGKEYTLKTSEGEVYTCNSKEMRDSFIKKVIFSSSPSEDSDYYGVAILNQTGDLAYCKKGDKFWKFIDDANSFCEDVVFHKGCFYAVSKLGTIAVCDFNGSSAPKVSFIETPRQIGGDMQYLVIWKDELLLVTRYMEVEFNMDQNKLDIVYKTTDFRVFKMVLSGPKWESLSGLDGCAVFVGENSSMAFCASEFSGCKGNCIYFTDDYSEWNYDGANGDHDLGIYDLENGDVVALPCYEKLCNGRRWPPPIWISPSLH